MKKYCGDRIKMWNPQVIIPVPLHADKIRSRGYNQAELLAKELGKNVGIPVDTELLKR